MNRYPDRDAVGAARRPRGLPQPQHRAPARRRPGVGGQRLQRGAAAAAAGVRRAGPHRARLRPDVLDAPADRRGHRHRAGCRWSACAGFRLEPEQAALVVARAPAGRRASSARRTTRPAPRWTSTWSRRSTTRRAGWWSSTRRTPSSRPARRRSPCCPAGERLVVTRTMSQGVRVRRAPGSATWPPTRLWSRRCSWSGCPTTCRCSPRRPRARRWPTPTSCSRRSRRS